jgi:hypothetical protein
MATLNAGDEPALLATLHFPHYQFGALIEEVKFASDSPLEGDGFELPVPRQRRHPRARGHQGGERPRLLDADRVNAGSLERDLLER